MPEQSTTEQFDKIKEQGYVEQTQTNNLKVIIIESGSNSIAPITTPLTTVTYDISEIPKAINIDISELSPFVQQETEETVLKSLYDDRLNDIKILQSESIDFQIEIDEKLEIINELLQISASLSSLSNSSNTIADFFKNQYSSSIEDINKLSVDLGKSLTELVEFKIKNSGLQALSAGLEAERNSLKIQVEILQQQVEGVESIISAGGEISGELGVGLIPDEPFEGVSTYVPKRFARSYRKGGTSTNIESSPKQYTIKNASTDFVTIKFTRGGENPYIVDFGYSGGGVVDGTNQFILQSGEQMVLTVEVSQSGTHNLRGAHAGRNKQYFCKILILVTSADKSLTEDLQIDCTINRRSR